MDTPKTNLRATRTYDRTCKLCKGKDKKKMKIVCFGDSLTAGFGVTSKERWSYLLQQKLHCQILNSGINGDTTSGMLSRCYEDIVLNKPTHVIIMAGTNDLFRYISLNRIEENIRLLLSEAINFSIIPILATIPPCDITMCKLMWQDDYDYSNFNNSLKQYRQWILNFCSENQLQCIDFYKVFMQVFDNLNTHNYLIDGIHPTALGHQLMAQNIEIK